MKRIIYSTVSLLVVAVGLMSSCKKKDEVNPIKCYLKAFKNPDGTNMFTYEYEASNRITRINQYHHSGSYIQQYLVPEYDATNKLTKINIFSPPATSPIAYLTLEYDTKGNATLIRNYSLSGATPSLFDIYSFEYNNNGLPTKFSLSSGIYFRYEYNSNGNLSKTFFYEPGKAERLSREATDYDNKLNAFSASRALQLIYLIQSYSNVFSNNNMTSYKYYKEDGSLQSLYTNTYEYNANGYPTKQTFHISQPGSPDYQSFYLFDYDCK